MPNEFQADIDAVARVDAVPLILNVVRKITGLRFAVVARVTESHWVTCAVSDSLDFGLQPGSELKIETTICNQIRQSLQPVVIDDVATDGLYVDHPIPAMYGFRSYISVPIVLADDSFFGTLCSLDPDPAKVKTPEIIGMFQLFAQLIATQLDMQNELVRTQSELHDERQMALLREQFVAALGHDLRNPVASLDAGTKLLLRRDLDQGSRGIVELMQASVTRMRGLVENLMDFARARLGGGISLRPRDGASLQPALQHVVDELRLAYPDRMIESHLELADPVCCDVAKVGQILSNLLANAINHGATDRPVRVHAETGGGTFTLWVENGGAPIPSHLLPSLFRPFFRGTEGAREGLGLGLYIATEIAQGHGGVLQVKSDATATRFTFQMPLSAVADTAVTVPMSG